VSASDSNQ